MPGANSLITSPEQLTEKNTLLFDLKLWEKKPMWEKQSYALDFAKQRAFKGVGLFMEMGTGKTRVGVHWIEHLVAKGARLGYVCAPLSAMHVWIQNWHEWADEPLAFIDLHDTGPAGLREAVRLSNEGKPVICLINYEMTWQLGHKRIARRRAGEEVKILEKVDSLFWDIDWDFGILDESTGIKTPASRVSKAFRSKIAPKTRCRMIATGSAYTKRPLDVWAQIKFITGEEIFPGPFERFKLTYAIPNPYIRGAILGYQNLDDLTRRLDQCCVLLKKEDVVDLPPFTHETRMVRLSAKSERLYNQLRDDLYAELEGLEEEKAERVAALKKELRECSDDAEAAGLHKRLRLAEYAPVASVEHIFSRIRKWQQITSGFIIPDRPEEEPDSAMEPIRLGTEKLDALYEVMEEREGLPTVIVVQMDEEEKIISEAFQKKYKFKPKVLNGSVKGAEARHKMIADAAHDRAFIVKESVGSQGVDMRWTDCIVFYSHRNDTIDYDQMMSRNHRGGVEWDKITYIHILAEDTYDEKVLRSLNADLDMAEELERNWRNLYEG